MMDLLLTWGVIVLMVGGSLLALIAAIGVVRLPDLFLRMSGTTKAATLGVGSILLAVALFSGEMGVAARALAIALFTMLTAPVAAHMIGRAAYLNGVPLWSGTLVDEMQDRYDVRTHSLGSSPVDANE
jgi:multicomponent Na+:H+ antiporter subunit G